MTDLEQWDDKMLDPSWYTRPEFHEAFTTLRNEDPVHWTQDTSYGKDYWALTRYDDVKDYLLDPGRFSSRWDTRVPRSPIRRTPEERHAQGWDISIATNDDPLHDVYRKPINKHFSVPAVARLGDEVFGIVDEIIAEVRDLGTVDLVEQLAAELPMKVILRMLGVPREDWDTLRIASWQWLAAADPRWTIDGDEVATSLHGHKVLLDYCTDLALQRRENPQDDFATVIGNLEIDGSKLSVHEMKIWFVTMIGGGLETTRNAAAVGTWLFLNNPDQLALMREEPSLAKSAIEEVLRWSTPAKNRLRIATQDLEFGGKRIKAGDWVIGYLASANKDERIFADPHRFDIRRTPNEHLALGTGIHLCLGRALARLELTAYFTKIFAAFPEMSLTTDTEPAWIADRSVTGFTALPVSLGAPSLSGVR